MQVKRQKPERKKMELHLKKSDPMHLVFEVSKKSRMISEEGAKGKNMALNQEEILNTC